MKSKHRYLAIMIAMGFAIVDAVSADSAPAEIKLAQDGKALVKIVRSANPIPAETTAVQELSDYLTKITGGKFEIIDEQALAGETPAIYVGPTEFAKKQGIEIEKLGKEESVIRTVNGRLILAGGRPRGTLYAVYIFLEEHLGVHWFTQWCETVPSHPVLAIKDINIQRHPYMEYRDHYGSGLQGITSAPPYAITIEWYRWIARNRLNGFGMGGGLWYKDKYTESRTGDELGGGIIPGGFPSHTFWYYFPPDEWYNKHPEFFSMRKGKRVYNSNAAISTSGNHLCLTNKELRKLMKEKVLEMFRKIPSADFVSISGNDGGEHTFCDCPECRAFVDQHGNEADLYYDFVNPIAEAVEKEFPGKLVYTLGGYQPVVDPPKNILPRGNVVVQNPSWKNAAKHIWAWDHAFSGAFVPIRYLKPSWWALDKKIKDWKQNASSVSGLSEEDEVTYTDPVLSEMYEIHPWLVAKLTENPDVKIDDLIKEFVNGCYGAAGPFLFDYFMLQKERSSLWPWRMVNYDYVHKAHQIFDKAESAVKDDPGLLMRVKDLRINLDYTTLAWRNNAIADYLRKGGKLEDYPYKKELLCERLLKSLSTTTHPYWNFKIAWCMGMKSSDKTMRDVAQDVVKRLAGGRDYAPLSDELPKAIREFTPDRIVDLSLGVFNYASFDPDPDAALGIAYNFSWKQFPFETAVYRTFVGQKEREGYASEPCLVGRQDIKGDGFHLYKAGRFTLDSEPGWSPLYLCHSWEYQVTMDSLKPTGDQKDVWEWYVSLKFKNGTNGVPAGEVLADRVILVNLGDASQIQKAGQAIPPQRVILVGRWIFDGTGENRAGDAEVRRMPDARLDNPVFIEGRFGKALALTKPSGIAVVPYDKRLTLLTGKSFTISMWFRTDKAQGEQVLMEQYADPEHFFTLKILNAKEIAFDSFDAGRNKPVGLIFGGKQVNPTDGKWHHVCAGFDKDRQLLFASIDGLEHRDTAFEQLPSIEEPIWIGAGGAGFLKGALDEVQIYLNALPNLHGGIVGDNP